MIRPSHKSPLLQINNNKGISVVKLFILLIVIVCALSVLKSGKQAAYEITAKRDLQAFANAEEAYYSENEEYLGEAGDIFSNNPDKPSTLSLEGFTPSEGIAITIISDDPFVAISKHRKADATFEYNFDEGIEVKQR
jgi:hypothetical protein